jgi:hypothetical protein
VSTREEEIHIAAMAGRDHFMHRCKVLEAENLALRRRLNDVGLEWLKMMHEGRIDANDRKLWDLATDEVKP